MRRVNHTLFFVLGNPAFEDCDAAVLGVAFDESSSFGRGAAKAPDAIMKASHNVEIEQPMTGKTLETAIHNFGVIEPKTAKAMITQTEKYAKKSLDANKFFILLGGDHSTVNGLLNAVPKDTAFVNFDAHLDLRQDWLGKKQSKQSHAAVSRRIFDKNFKQVWIGVRDAINEEEIEFVSEHDLADKIFYCPTMPRSFYRKHSFPEWMHKKNTLFNKKTKKSQLKAIVAAIETEKVWLNIDIDCLDLRQGIETGAPMPFGLTLENLNELLYEICLRKKVVGFSLAEVRASNSNSSQTIAAILCCNILCWTQAKSL